MSTSPVEVPNTFMNTGLELYSDLPFKVLVGAIWPFTLALIVVLLLATFAPPIVLWIPNLVFG